MRELAERVNASASTINNLEKDQVEMNITWIKRLSKIFEVPVDQFLGLSSDEGAIVDDEVVAFDEEQTHASSVKLTDAQILYEVKSRSLDQLGVAPGTVLVVDGSKQEFKTLQTEDIVIARLHEGIKPILLLRQYVSPSLLITNSAELNAVLNLRTHNVGIVGIVVAAHSQFRRESRR